MSIVTQGRLGLILTAVVACSALVTACGGGSSGGDQQAALAATSAPQTTAATAVVLTLKERNLQQADVSNLPPLNGSSETPDLPETTTLQGSAIARTFSPVPASLIAKIAEIDTPVTQDTTGLFGVAQFADVTGVPEFTALFSQDATSRSAIPDVPTGVFFETEASAGATFSDGAFVYWISVPTYGSSAAELKPRLVRIAQNWWSRVGGTATAGDVSTAQGGSPEVGQPNDADAEASGSEGSLPASYRARTFECPTSDARASEVLHRDVTLTRASFKTNDECASLQKDATTSSGIDIVRSLDDGSLTMDGLRSTLAAQGDSIVAAQATHQASSASICRIEDVRTPVPGSFARSCHIPGQLILYELHFHTSDPAAFWAVVYTVNTNEPGVSAAVPDEAQARSAVLAIAFGGT